jgi:ribonucleoside-triphosphate reductase
VAEAPIFTLRQDNRFNFDPSFLARFHGRTPPRFGPLGLITFLRTYSRRKPDGTMETVPEVMTRVISYEFGVGAQQVKGFNQEWDEERAQRDAQEAFTRWWDGKWSPPGRGVQNMGTVAVEMKGGGVLNNCGLVSTKNIDKDFSEPFITLMDYSMLGVGMGFDVRGANKVRVVDKFSGDPRLFVVEDSREGWMAALRVSLDAAVGKCGYPIGFDYSKVRPKDSLINTFGGKASGPEPLRQLLDGVKKLLTARKGKFVTSSDIVDIMNIIGVCVVSGNVRRSAEIAIGFPDDSEFVRLKDPSELNQLTERLSTAETDAERVAIEDAISTHPLVTHRWASNNTVLCDRNTDYESLAKLTVENGEPGYAWPDIYRGWGRLCDPPNYLDDKADGMNPCNEQTLWDGELCCLVDVFPMNHLKDDGSFDEEDYNKTLQCAFFYAKTVTCIPTHRPKTNAVISRNRRIGLSMAGVFHMYEAFGPRECARIWDDAYRYVRELDKDYSGWMGVPQSIKVTSIKPGGTIPLLWGIEGGMKLPSSRYYYRTIRLSDTSELLPRLRAAGYRVEKAEREPQTVVAYFPQEDKRHKRFARDVSLWEQAFILSLLQERWSDNMVSATLNFKASEKDDVARILRAFEGKLKSVSFNSPDEHGYPQAPYQTITREEYERAVSTLLPLDLSNLTNAHDRDEKYCDGDKCEVEIKTA